VIAGGDYSDDLIQHVVVSHSKNDGDIKSMWIGDISFQ